MTKKSSSSESQTLCFVLDVIHEGVWDWDANSGNVERSPGWYQMLGFEKDSLEPTVFTWEDIIHPDDYARVMSVFEDYINGNSNKYECEYRCRKKDGTYLWILDHGKIVERTQDGAVARMIGAHTNIHEQKIAQLTLQKQNKMLMEDNFNLENVVRERTLELNAINQWLEAQVKKSEMDANTDVLTSLYNRRKIEQELIREIARAKRYSSPLSLALLDADFFKKINDEFGHSRGDSVLKQLADIISAQIRESDIAARWGGEEFMLILPETNLVQAEVIAEKLRLAIMQATIDDTIQLTCSIGVTEFQLKDSRDDLFQRLDRALYQAKEKGRNQVISLTDSA